MLTASKKITKEICLDLSVRLLE